MQLQRLQDDWEDYRRALRKQEQPHFDRLFEHAADHADAAGYMNPAEPVVPVLVSILLEQEKRIAELERQVSASESE